MTRTESSHTIKLSEINPEMAARVAATKQAREEGVAAALEGKALTDNPYKMVAYGDPGYLRPAWFDGFNAGLLQKVGLPQRPDLSGGQLPDAIRDLIYPIPNHDIRSAEAAAEKLTVLLGFPFWPEDRGNGVSPRYGVRPGFRIGEPVSRAFNGDYYPVGFITKMSGQGNEKIGFRRIEVTDTNGKVRVFWRRDMSGSWINAGMWSLVPGWHNDQNPEF